MTDKAIYTPVAVFESTLLGECCKKYRHSSGLDIYIFPKKLSSSFALFGTKYGSVDNVLLTEDGEKEAVPEGVAHFLEHKLFTAEDGSDAFERFSALGADANAYTAFNRTGYYFVSSECFYESLGELCDLVTHPYFTKETVASEVGIISEEIAMYDDSPSERCLFGMLGGMYHRHAVKENICGSAQSIRRITPELLYKCHRTFYRPDNMMMIVCGDVEDVKVLDTVCAHIPDTIDAKKLCRADPAEGEPREVVCEYVEQSMPVSKPLFSIGFKDTDIPFSPRERQKKDAELAIVNEILFSRSGELYSSLIDKRLVSPAMSYGYTISKTFAYNSVSGEADDPRAVLDEILAYIEKIKRNGLDHEDFLRAKRVMYADSVRVFDSVEGIGNAMFSVICEDGEIFEQVESTENVTFEDTQSAFLRFFASPNITLSVIKPIN